MATSELLFNTVGLIFVGLLSKISVTPTNQRTIFVKPLVKYSCTKSIMCLKIEPATFGFNRTALRAIQP